VEIDPQFASAYFQLEGVTRQLGDQAAAEMYRKKALEHVAHLPERQRLLLEALSAQREGPIDRATEILERLIKRYPDEEEGYQQLGNIRTFQGDLVGALEAFQRGVNALPKSGGLRNGLGYGFMRLGRYPEALAQLEEYARMRPNEPNPYDSLAETYLVSGQPEKALEKYARVLEINGSFYNAHNGRALAFGMLGRFDEALAEARKLQDAQLAARVPRGESRYLTAFLLSRVGRYRDSTSEIVEGLKAAQQVTSSVQSASLHFLTANIAFDRSDFSRAESAAAEGLRFIPKIPEAQLRRVFTITTTASSGVVQARQGRLDAARARLDEARKIADVKQSSERWALQVLEAEIALAAGNPAQAEQAMGSGDPATKAFFSVDVISGSMAFNNLSWPDEAARVRRARGDTAGAIAAYRRLLTPDISQKWTLVYEPRWVLEMARLLDQQGDKAGARAEYQRFADLWKNADPGLPELAEARTKLGR